MNFGQAFNEIREGQHGMRLPNLSEDVIVKSQIPDAHSKMSAPYLYVESRFGRVPWKETYVELYSNDWVVR